MLSLILLFPSFIYAFYLPFFDFLYLKFCSSQPNLKPSGRVVTVFTPIPACRDDFSRIKLTSFEKLIEKTCSTIKNVRLSCEPDQKPGGVSGNSGVAPDAA